VSFLAELKRRNVFKVGAAYLALAWLVLQLTSIVVPAFELPAWTLKFVIWFGVIGFPCVLVFAWIYELTPDGLKRDSEVEPGKSITGQTGKKLDYVIIALLVLAIGLFLLQYLRPPAPAAPANTAEAVATLAISPSAPGEQLTAPKPKAAVAPDDKSIAVLPFVNMSSDKEQEYFSDGMSEELLNLLAQVHDLKVIARTSSFAFKGKDVPIAEIAKQLNVAHVLEGSVRKAGNTVRITAQLIRTADSTHLWSETYDRPLDDIFKVQDEIAGAIAQALQIKLAGGTLSRREGGTHNLEAYDLYLRAVRATNLNSRASLESATRYVEHAVSIDPEFGRAWSQWADALLGQADSGMVDATLGYQSAREKALHALELSPELAQAHGTLLYVYRNLDWDFAAAAHEEQEALAIDPADVTTLVNAGLLSVTLGRWVEAEKQFRAALDRDPLNPLTVSNLATALYSAGRFADAEAEFRRVLQLSPDFLWGRGYLGKALVAQGKAEEAIALVQTGADESYRVKYLPIMLQAAGREIEAEVAMKEQIEQWADNGAYFIAMTYAMRGNSDLALEWLERAYRQRDSSLPEILGEPLFKNIAHDPRFIAFLKKMNLPTEPVPVNWQ
jgi:TolB-like protein/lipoprotein NlpI